MTTNEIYDYIEQKIVSGSVSTIVSGKIHKELGLNNRHPMVCLAMRKLTKKFKHEIIDDHTGSGQTSTLTIKYSIK